MASVAESRAALHRAPLGGNLKFVIAGAVIVLAVAYLVVIGLQGTTEYFLTVTELQSRGTSAQNQVLRVSGDLVPGSLVHDSTGFGVHFLIADVGSSSPLSVTYKGGQVPDTMDDPTGPVEIVAEGKLDGQGTFAASNVLAKCPSRLSDATPTERDYSGATN